jgi:hypothetical protein
MSKKERKNEYYGALAEFSTAYELFHACEKVRDRGFCKWDAHTPFPVHGLERAMGVPASKVPWIVLCMGMTGATTGLVMQWWMNAVNYPFIISGKPLFALPPAIPVTFELTILFSALGAVFGMLGINKLPMWYHSLFNSKRFESVTDDKFFISIESKDPQFDAKETLTFLEELGADHVELVEP